MSNSDTHRVRYVEYQGDGYRVDGVQGNSTLILSQVGKPAIEVPVSECTPTNEWGDPIDTAGVLLEPRHVWSEIGGHQ